MGGSGMFQHVSQEVRERVLKRDHRRCQVCMKYFGDHRPMDVVVRDPDKIVVDDSNLMSVCFACNEVIQNLRRVKPAA